jgi:hypothetical protein
MIWRLCSKSRWGTGWISFCGNVDYEQEYFDWAVRETVDCRDELA